ncbi:MAG: hypothetical protein JNM68_10375 [Dinghuibacter sp.]|nr:hypothetical protein [Dinghuibacter sp.]
MKKILVILSLFCCVRSAQAQLQLPEIDWGNLQLDNILGKVLNVKKGFAPKFSLGSLPIPKIGKVSKIINLKNIETARKLFNTFKAGRTVYKFTSYAGSAASLYGTISNIANNAKDQVNQELKKTSKTMIISGLSSVALGLVVKFITKTAAYKAVDAFNGVARKTLKDIISFGDPAPSPYVRAGVALKLQL